MRPLGWVLMGSVLAMVLASTLSACRNSGPSARFPDEWFYEGNQSRLVGRPAPELTVSQWHGGEPVSLAELRGEIVLLDFWGSWCGPCRRAIPHTDAVAERLRSEGVRVLGVHSQRGHENMVKAAQELGMRFPTAKDEKGETARDYATPFWPFYVLIDRKGVVRAAGLSPDHVDDAVAALLAEQPGRRSS